MNEIALGIRISKARKAKNLSQADLASLLHISKQAVGKWERGESLPDALMLISIAKSTETDLQFFTSDDSEPTITPAAKSHNTTTARNMSRSQWRNADFSNLSNISAMGGANVQNCKFTNADLSSLAFKANNMINNNFEKANLSGCKFTMSNVQNNNFSDARLTNATTSVSSNFKNNNFSRADLTNATLKGKFTGNTFTDTIFNGTNFQTCQITKTIFSGTFTNCCFQNCAFKNVEFQNATFTNTFVKGTLKNVKFQNCEADKISLEFIKTAGADTSNIKVIN